MTQGAHGAQPGRGVDTTRNVERTRKSPACASLWRFFLPVKVFWLATLARSGLQEIKGALVNVGVYLVPGTGILGIL